MDSLKKIIPLTIIPAAIYAMYHLFFREIFLPPSAEKNSSFKLLNSEGINYLEENGVPYATYINQSTYPLIDLNGNWLFRLDRKDKGIENKWFLQDFSKHNHRLMAVPGSFNTAASPLRDYVGSVWYQKKFNFNKDLLKGSANWLRLSCLGSAFKTWVWLNGNFIGYSNEGYLPFFFDVTDKILLEEENTLTFKVSNELDYDSLPPKHYDKCRLGWHQFGGIHKSIIIESLPRSYCFKINPITSFSTKEGTINVKALFENRQGREDKRSGEVRSKAMEVMEVKITIKGPDGKKCAEKTGRLKFTAGKSVAALTDTIKIKSPLLWSAESPALYRLILKTPYEEQQINFGFRSLRTENEKIIINGNQVILKGISRHEEDLPDGQAQKPESISSEMSLIKKCGGNYARLAHYPHHPEALDYGDRHGLYVWTEIALYRAGMGFLSILPQKTKVDKDRNLLGNILGTFVRINQLTRPLLMSNARESLLKLAERHMNHPSIIFWGLGNECWSFNAAGAKALLWLKKQLLQLDNTRFISYAVQAIPGITEPFERAFSVVDVIAVNEYHGWYYGKPEDAEKFLEKIHRQNPGKPIIVSETGADCLYGEHDTEVPPAKGYSEEYQRQLLKTKWDALAKKPWFGGWSIWALKDFLCMEYLEDNPLPYYNLKGVIDRNNRPKLAYHLLKSLYND